MAVSMRLTRVGGKKDPVWRVVVADRRSPRDGRFIETLGRYNPQTDPSTIVLNEERDPATGSPAARSPPSRSRSSSRPRASARQPLAPRARAARVPRAARSSTTPTRCKVEEFEEDDGTLVLELSVDEDDYGQVIGRGGRTAQALRTVVKAAAVKDNRRVLVDIVE